MILKGVAVKAANYGAAEEAAVNWAMTPNEFAERASVSVDLAVARSALEAVGLETAPFSLTPPERGAWLMDLSKLPEGAARRFLDEVRRAAS